MPYGAPVTTPPPVDFAAQQKQGLMFVVGGAGAALVSTAALPGLLRILGTLGGMGVAAYGWMKTVEATVKQRADDQIKMGSVVAECVGRYLLTGAQAR